MAGKMIRNLAIANAKLDPHHFDDVVNQRDVRGGGFLPGLQLEEWCFRTGRFLWNHLGLPCLKSPGRKVMEDSMFRKIVIALVATAVIASVPTGAFARGGFGGFGGGGF